MMIIGIRYRKEKSKQYKMSDIKAKNKITQCLADNMLKSIMDKKWPTIENTIYELKSSGGSTSDPEIITLLLSSMPESYAMTRAIDIIFSKHIDDIDLNYVKNALPEEELRESDKTSSNEERLVAFKSKKKFVSNRWKNKYVSNRGYKTQSNVPFRFNCQNCGGKGHKKSECKFSLGKRNINSTSNIQRCESDGRTAFFVANSDQNVNIKCLMTNSSIINFAVHLGATNHMINREYEEPLVNTIMDVNLSIAVAKRGFHLQAHNSGTLKLTSQEGKSIIIKYVLSCDNFHSFKVIFDNAEVKILNKNSEVVVTGSQIGNLYMIKFQIDFNTALTTSNEDLMHRRLSQSSRFPPKNCLDICIQGKQTRKVSKKRLPLEKNLL
ncbi:hypothetical protein PR048_004701 [Dryococelus australis]|uniref:CCHC-type domain-containing protein n=1 Tax=Dryococelus australis TaxID=614101 RepID=A0ABQ9I654_9NEOP|nr:hypothetical protein PR048_004701 [Dryococelus australis]